MPDAIITDITEFRNKKKGSVLSKWSDDKLQKRYKVLEFIENGADYLTDPSHPLVQMSFPRGFDPQTHEEDNISALRTEADRRGVVLT